MTLIERLRTTAQLQEDDEVAFLLMQAADRIENLNMWKIKWAEMDHAYAELLGRYSELQKTFDNYRQEK